MKNILREAWFLVIPGTLLLCAAIRDVLSHSMHLRVWDAPLSAAAGSALLAGAYAFAKPTKRGGTVLVLLGFGIGLVYPTLIASDATYYVWLVVCLFFAAGAMYLSLTHRQV